MSDNISSNQGEAEVATDDAVWPEASFRHAYLPEDHRVAICGYDGPSTWKCEGDEPRNLCPICRAVLPEFWDSERKVWIKHS